MKPITFLFCVVWYSVQCQQLPVEIIRGSLLTDFWDAYWVAHPTASGSDYGVFHFRNHFNLEDLPDSLVIHVSADNRYQLFVNGKTVCDGPSRGDVSHWRFETVDIASFLQIGKNSIAAVVWNFGLHRPVFQQTLQTAFILQSNDPKFNLLNTGSNSWKVIENEAYAPEIEGIKALRSYHVVGPGEKIEGGKYPWGWNQIEFDDTDWLDPARIRRGHPKESGSHYLWGLEPRTIPLMESDIQLLSSVRDLKGCRIGKRFLEGSSPVTLAAQSEAVILLDHGHLTSAHIQLHMSGGKGSTVTLTYAESLFDEHGQKGNRDIILGKSIRGQQDIFMPDGGSNRTFETLWFRTYRYLQLDIQTGEQPLIMHKIAGRYNGYPFQENASFKSDNPSLDSIWQMSWRTARLCAGETYYDCPYYEQLQYVGDTRIQALISLYVSGDDRLMRKSILAFDQSRISEGLTQSRYPSNQGQVIPTYSLFWINMVHDYWMHRQDEVFIHSLLPGIRSILEWYIRKNEADPGLIGNTGYWNFVDWIDIWRNPGQPGGVPPLEGGSSILSLQTIYAIQSAVELLYHFGDDYHARRYETFGKKLQGDVLIRCWDEERGLFGDTPSKRSFSQHANILAYMTNTLPDIDKREFARRVASDESLVQTTFYFRFYLFEMLYQAGLGDLYVGMLRPWRDMLKIGLTTCAERPEPTRSDCHAWSASPNYHLLSLVCGVRPNEPGFQSVRIEPNLGDLNFIEGSLPHPKGEITITIEKLEQGIEGLIVLPEGLSGLFVWKGETFPLAAGSTRLSLSGQNIYKRSD